jgi:hypothetical protein
MITLMKSLKIFLRQLHIQMMKMTLGIFMIVNIIVILRGGNQVNQISPLGSQSGLGDTQITKQI